MSSADSDPLTSAPTDQTADGGSEGKPTPSAEAVTTGESAASPQLPPGELSAPTEAAGGAAADAPPGNLSAPPGQLSAPPPAADAPPGNLSAPPGALSVPASAAASAPAMDAVESEDKLKAIAQFKAAIQQSLQKKTPKPDTEALQSLCLCLQRRGSEDSVCKDLAKLLTEKVGENVLVPLMGVKRKPAVAAPAQRADAEKKYVGRVKSYNTRKGFGFIDGGGVHRDIFVYNNRLVGRIGLIAGELVEFELLWDDGRPQARAVRVLDPSTKPSLSFDRQTPLEPPMEQANAARNPLGALKQAMMQPSAEERAREMALAAAAAASEVPTKMPQSKPAMSAEAQLAEKVREAQSAAARDKRMPMPKPEPPSYSSYQDWHAPPSQSHGPAMQPPAPSSSFDSGAKFSDEGNIPRGATVRVTNFPATDVNNQTGLVQGYDAATARYAVLVHMQKPNEGGSETVPLQLREEYLIVTQLPTGARGRGGRGGAPQGGAGGGMAPLPVSHASSALKRSAEDALRRFNLVPAPMAPGQAAMPPGMKGGGLMPGMSHPGGKGAQDAPRLQQQMAQQPRPVQQPQRVPQPLPQTSTAKSGPMQQPKAATPSTGMRLEQYARPAAAGIPSMGPATPMAPQQSAPMAPAMGMPGAAQAPARAPLIQAAQLPAPKAVAVRGEKRPSAPEGRPGAQWRVLQSKEFQDVIIRETQEVTSPLMDRIKPGETCIQRGETVELLSGLVRMPIEPRGWVTVHARLIGGPTFMEELPNAPPIQGTAPAPAPAPVQNKIPTAHSAPPPAAVPKSAFAPAPAPRAPLIPPQARAPEAQRPAAAAGISYKKTQMLMFQQVCRRTQQAPRDALRTLRMDFGPAPERPERGERGERKHHRGDKERGERRRDQKADPDGDDRRTPQRERRNEGRAAAGAPLAEPPAARPGPDGVQPPASGEEKKADCPTQ